MVNEAAKDWDEMETEKKQSMEDKKDKEKDKEVEKMKKGTEARGREEQAPAEEEEEKRKQKAACTSARSFGSESAACDSAAARRPPSWLVTSARPRATRLQRRAGMLYHEATRIGIARWTDSSSTYLLTYFFRLAAHTRHTESHPAYCSQ